MRRLRWISLAAATILAVAPAKAQRYDPRYPVCFEGEAAGQHDHRLQLYIIGSVQDDGLGPQRDMLCQPVLAASKSGTTEPRPSAARPRLLGRGVRSTRDCGLPEPFELLRLGAQIRTHASQQELDHSIVSSAATNSLSGRSGNMD
jgi:hypothetical protein